MREEKHLPTTVAEEKHREKKNENENDENPCKSTLLLLFSSSLPLSCLCGMKVCSA